MPNSISLKTVLEFYMNSSHYIKDLLSCNGITISRDSIVRLYIHVCLIICMNSLLRICFVTRLSTLNTQLRCMPNEELNHFTTFRTVYHEKVERISFEGIMFQINPYLTNGFSHHYQLEESTFIFRGVSSDFLILFNFSMKFKQTE